MKFASAQPAGKFHHSRRAPGAAHKWLWPAIAGVSTALMLCHAMAASAPASLLKIESGGSEQVVTAADLLSRRDAVTLELAVDPIYGKGSRSYKAVPMTAVIDSARVPSGASIQFRATDGFVATIPADQLLNTDRTRPMAWIAVEPPGAPWPPLPQHPTQTAGPFALIWNGPGSSKVWSEYWPYQMAQIEVVPDPAAQWPQLSVNSQADPSVSRGRQVFVAQCMPCHQLDGGGPAKVGPDLASPMSPVDYFGTTVLRQYIRNPGSVRDWPGRQMSSFPPERLDDRDLDALVSFLEYKRPKRADKR